ncbi:MULTISPECIES: ParB/Srx family N-terminal domain-containing protein [unclassified Afipia]|jgi:ParB family chromosome partitioning protein|uniref:ParB/RepB/Spo0J family partition protein n=1 Tax=unclassified Afipia TaxID=2642050 RepID=UPI0003F90368|nr:MULTISPECIES: ParB/Srx family N-terminal domain-containing protein [unclassified Afipia]WIG54002.1 MAG: ParB-like nuclease [Afipia sp.]
MAKAAKKKRAPAIIVFSRARDIPFNRIRLSEANVRQTGVEAGVDDLARDIDRREDLIQGLNVRVVLDADGNETGDFETPAGGRRYRSIARLVEAGRFPADGLVPCIVKKADAKTSATDDSLAENTFRLALHPLDQFKAFQCMVDGGMSTEEVASAYFTSQRYVDQRLALAKVSPKLHDVYAQDAMTLAMLEAFTAHPDHARQEQVWEAVKQSYYREPSRIRSMLTETTVAASDKRALFVGIDAYMAAGGQVLPSYLFDDDENGWLEDVALLDRLVAEKLKVTADEVAAEGWKWVNADLELPYGHDHGLRAITGTFAPLTKKEQRQREKLREEQERLETEYAEYDELPDDIDHRLGEIEKQLDVFERRPAIYNSAEIAIAGAFVTVDEDGALVVDRGWVRPEDEQPETVDGNAPQDNDVADDTLAPDGKRTVVTIGGQPAEPEEEEEIIKPLPERLVAELTAHRTVALSDAVGSHPHIAMTALLHRLVRDTFKRSTSGSAVQVSMREVYFREQGIDLKDSAYAKSVSERHAGWKADLPADDDALWDWLDVLDDASRMALLAHCVSFGINALYERPNPMSATGISEHGLRTRMAEADRLARVTGLDMSDAGFRPTVANYLGRVTKPRILEAIHEALGEEKVRLIDHLKKDDMAREAERLLADTGWLPEPLRLIAEAPAVETSAGQDGGDVALPEFLAGGDEEAATDAIDDPTVLAAAE